MIKPSRKNFLDFKTLRKAIESMRQHQVRADLNGDIHFHRWEPFDERASWLCGKPVGGA